MESDAQDEATRCLTYNFTPIRVIPELEKKDKQIASLQEQLKEQSERSDTIILQITRQNQLMLEDKTTPWYQRWSKRRKQDLQQ